MSHGLLECKKRQLLSLPTLYPPPFSFIQHSSSSSHHLLFFPLAFSPARTEGIYTTHLLSHLITNERTASPSFSNNSEKLNLYLGSLLVHGLVGHVGANGDEADEDEGAEAEASAAADGLQGAVRGGDGGFGLGVGFLIVRTC
jgi:hypothetical protein